MATNWNDFTPVDPSVRPQSNSVSTVDWSQFEPVDKKDRASSASLLDYAKGVGAGVGQLISGIGYLGEKVGARATGKDLRYAGDQMSKVALDSMTPEGRRAAHSQVFEDDPNSALPKLSDRWGQAALMGAAQSAPSMVASAIPGGIAAGLLSKGAGALAARGIGGALAPIAAGSASPVGTWASNSAGQIAARAPSAIGMGAGEGIASGAMNAAQTKSQIEAMPESELARHPDYSARAALVGPLQARAEMADAAASDVLARTTLSTGVIGALTGGGALGLGYRNMSGVARDGLIKSTLKGGGQEAVQETLQSGPEQLIQNVAIRDYANPDQNVMEGVVSGALSGGAVGGLMGAATGAGGHLLSPRDHPAPPRVTLPPNGPLANAVNPGIETGATSLPGTVAAQPQPSTLPQSAELALAQTAAGPEAEVAPSIRQRQDELDAIDPFSDGAIERRAALQSAVTRDAETSIAAGDMPVYRSANGMLLALHPSTRSPGMIQVTRYNESGVLGDSQYASVGQAIEGDSLHYSQRLTQDDAATALTAVANAEQAYQARRQAAEAALLAKKTAEAGDDAVAQVVRSLQNRNRSSAASAAQMAKIASAPDPDLLMAAPTMSDGAPVVSALMPAAAVPQAQIGKDATVSTAKRKIAVRYAVVDAASLSASNHADGSRNVDYALDPAKLVAINNGRTAGLIEAYRRGTAGAYRAAVENAQEVHGIAPDVIRGIKAPVLVRLMDVSDVTDNIGDESNAVMTLGLSATEQARNDASRLDMSAIDYDDDGHPTPQSMRLFIASMPDAERQSLAPNGEPTKQAIDRVSAAVFHSAYDNAELVGLMAEATDPDAINVLRAMSRAAASMGKLKDAGDLDIRQIVTGAAIKVVNAARSGVSMKKFLAQADLLDGSLEQRVAELFARNSRSVKAIAQRLVRAAETAYAETLRDSADIFGDVIPQASRDDIIRGMTDDTRSEEDLGQQGGGRPRNGDDGTDADHRRTPGDSGGAQVAQVAQVEQSGHDYGAGTGDLLASYSERELRERQSRIEAAEKEKARLEAALDQKSARLNRKAGAAIRPKNPNDDLFSGQGSLFSIGRRYDTKTLDLFTSVLPARPGEDTAASRADRLGLASAALVRGSRGSLLGLALSADWIRGNGSSLLGKRVTSAADLATLGAVLRDPRAETMRYFLLKDGKIVYHTAVSSRLESSSAAFVGDPDAFLGGLNDTMTRLGADGYYLMHNHPSRRVDASTADVTLTAYIAERLPGFLGHVILDHLQFGLIEPDRRSAGQGIGVRFAGAQALEVSGPDPTRSGALLHPVLDTPVTHPSALAGIANLVRQPDNVVLVSTDAQLRITGLMQVAADDMKDGTLTAFKNMMRLRKATGSKTLFAVLPEGLQIGDLARAVTSRGWLLDVSSVAIEFGRTRAVSAAEKGLIATTTRRDRDLTGVVDQPRPSYGTPDLFATMQNAEREEIAAALRKNSPQMDLFAALDQAQKGTAGKVAGAGATTGSGAMREEQSTAERAPEPKAEPERIQRPDSLNLLRNPVASGDTIEFADGSKWLAKEGWTGGPGAWTLLQGKTPHPTVAGIKGQAEFIRAIIEENENTKMPTRADPSGEKSADATTPDWARAKEILRLTRPVAPKRIHPNETPVLEFIENGWSGTNEQFRLEAKRRELAKALGVEIEKYNVPGSMSNRYRIVSAPTAVREATLGDIEAGRAPITNQENNEEKPTAPTQTESSDQGTFVDAITGEAFPLSDAQRAAVQKYTDAMAATSQHGKFKLFAFDGEAYIAVTRPGSEEWHVGKLEADGTLTGRTGEHKALMGFGFDSRRIELKSTEDYAKRSADEKALRDKAAAQQAEDDKPTWHAYSGVVSTFPRNVIKSAGKWFRVGESGKLSRLGARKGDGLILDSLTHTPRDWKAGGKVTVSANGVVPFDKAAEAASETPKSNTEDAGSELTYNRRNRLNRGLKWEDIADKNVALRVREVVKAKVYPKPDYPAMTDAGMPTIAAHLVKQVYDSIAVSPAIGRREATDDDLKRYIQAVNRVMDGVQSWAADPKAMAEWASRHAREAAAMMGKVTNLSDLEPSKSLLDTVYPGDWKDYRAEVMVLGGNKLLGALQPGYDEAKRAVKDIGKGWPEKREAWQQQGYRIVEGNSLKTTFHASTRMTGEPYVSVLIASKVGDKSISVDNFSISGARSEIDSAVVDAVTARLSKLENKFILLDKANRNKGVFETQNDAEAAAREATRREAKKGEIREEGRAVEDAERIGPAHRLEGEAISSDTLKETFGFKGVNFGNWMKGDSPALRAERQLHLNHAYDAFLDLSELMNVPPKAMSLDGMLGLAIGAQGNGGRAAAHFVPGVNEINLTRVSGAGALAHEWGHGLDHYFATLGALERQTDPYLTEHVGRPRMEQYSYNGRAALREVPMNADLRPEIIERFKAIVAAMTKRNQTQAESEAQDALVARQYEKSVESWLASIRRDFAQSAQRPGTEFTPEMRASALARFDTLAARVRALDLGDGKLAVSTSVAISPVVAEIRETFKSAFGRPLSIDSIKALQANIDALKYKKEQTKAGATHTPQQIATDYSKASSEADAGKNKRYWSTKREMFARAFDAFVVDTLAEKAAKNSYLAGIEAVAPQGEERKAIDQAFKALVDAIETRVTASGVALFDINPERWSKQHAEAAKARAIDLAIQRAQGLTIPTERKPAILSRLRTILDRYYAGDSTAGRVVNELSLLTQSLLQNKANRRFEPTTPRTRGADFFRQKLLEAKRRGTLSADEANFAEWLVQKNPALLDDLALSIRTAPEGSHSAGNYDAAMRMVTLFKEHASDETAVHEVLHHLERMLPDNVRGPIVRAWRARIAKELKTATGQRKQMLEAILEADALPSPKAVEKAIDLMEDYADYHLLNPSEFWAVNGARILRERFDAKDSTFDTIKQWMIDVVEKLKSLMGMTSDAALIRALDNVLKGDGTFVADRMLSEMPEFSALEPDERLAPREGNITISRRNGFLHAYTDAHGLPDQPSIDRTLDGAELQTLRRAAAHLERTERGVFFRIEADGRAVASGPKGTRIPEAYRRFANDHGLAFFAQRRIPKAPDASKGEGGNAANAAGWVARNSEPMPLPYRESGAHYFGEDVGQALDRTQRARFSLAGSPSARPRPSMIRPLRDIQGVVDKFKARFKGVTALDIRVVASVDEIPAPLRPSPFAEGVFHDEAKLIYLIAENLLARGGQANTQRAYQTLLHEAVGHYGLARMMGDRFDAILKAVMQVARDPSITDDSSTPGDPGYASVEAVRLRYPEASENEVAQEVIARLAESDPGSRTLHYLRAVVRQWFRDTARALGVRIQVTTKELNDLIAKASADLRRGKNLERLKNPATPSAARNGLESRRRIVGDSGRDYSPHQRVFFRNVGRDIEPKGRIQKTLDSLRSDFWKKLAVGLVDQFRGLRDLDDGGQAYLLARLSKGTAGAFDAFLHHGKLSIRDGVYDGDTSGGVVERLGIPLRGELDDLLWWIAANRAEGFKAEQAKAQRDSAAKYRDAEQKEAQARDLEQSVKSILQQAGNFPKSMTGNQRAQKANARQADAVAVEARALRAEVAELRKEARALGEINRERLFTDDDVSTGKSLAAGITAFDYTLQTGPGKGRVTRHRAVIYADAQRVFNEFQKNALDLAEESGLIDGASRSYWESEFYVPFYRVSEDDGEFIGARMVNALVRQQAFKKLKGGTDKLNSDLLSNTLLNWSHLIEAAARNRAAQAALEAAEKVGSAHRATFGEKNTVWFMAAGKKIEYGVDDPFVLTAITSLEYAGMRNGVMDAMTTFKGLLTIGVTASPAFKVRNLIRDSIQAMGTSELGYNPVRNVVEGYRLTKRDAQDYVSALASGGLIRFGTMLEGAESSRVRQLVKAGVKESSILDSPSKWRAFYDRYIDPGIAAYNELGNRSEEINRAALYNQLIRQGRRHAEAALMARDLMDFSMQGSFNTIRFLAQVVPFFNARLQGMYKLGRAAHDDPRKLAVVTGAVALASLALMARYIDDDDWKRREDWDRDNYWWFKLAGIEYRIPKPFELGAVASLAERSVESLVSDEMTSERFRKVLGNLALNNLSMNPVPQLVKPIIDLYANKDSFTGRPIETLGMQRLEPSMRYNGNTSMPARGLSTATLGALSPVQYDHLARAYFGWLGAFAVGSADLAVRIVSNEPTRPTTDYFKFVTQGFLKEAGGGNSRYVTMLYDQAAELEQAYATYRRLVKDRKLDEARAYAEANAEALRRHRSVAAVKNVETRLNQTIHAIEIGDLSPDEKKARIGRIQKMKERVAMRIAPGVR